MQNNDPVKYCKKCVMPSTRPGISFNAEGVCSACQSYEKRGQVDWSARMREFEELCDKYRGMNGPGGYDCAIAVSGGKDSHYQVYVMKEKMGMNPILFSVEDNFTMTKAGAHNLRNISEAFGCNIISIKPDIRTQKILMRKTFERYGKPTWFLDRMIYTYPLSMALKFNTPLLVYGENVSFEYGGADAEETYSARGILKNGVASDIPMEELTGDGVTEKDLSMTIAPTAEQLDILDPIYISYFLPWNSVSNYEFAKRHGFRDLTHEWRRTMCAEDYDQVDSFAYLVHAWMKYPKFGHACTTDYTSRFIRYGLMSREEAMEMIRERDHALDVRAIEDFLAFTGYSAAEFYDIVDRFYNRDLFKKDDFGRWILKKPVWDNHISG